MTKQDLVNKLADMAGMTKVDAAKALDTLSDVVTAALKKGEKVTWTGFGTFEVRSRAARMGRNPQTGAPMHIAASKTPAFKAGKSLKDSVR
ncbi:DNA-binding protein HU [candidate division WWE3 bacterium RIFCSPHIGHO2_12_FULL_38_15]|uniref:DNA-binding protein HU n=1 Tax=candidate division WWE3 bacterium RIFCSPHIGHO2_02_FULL_38_14 TaxID=1802620 RepID=A0A1F4VAZ1_UNCKA|nr:MAG: DNA-binding protein HU [candidate division WWE3 bacterium RIFCSPHIGHO2_01_FULL_38_45]OGC48458.1 MAG: DNA-binding protein HU [candidate division WWE3 bacterium RIFCSPHIGHO2_12_FULL_38_15]OGC52889.1 MAG: DNA-binding protein HU [candidate division WWE3 bacterium RIFCSPLOWO2_01_FULL_37_24]OGC54392.1 MAG: DNA-binding protein HU [candidate division WWE3 bacterium RIFCSPHIGHO2_02_FULL_38_14]HLB51636.1 HU family DNA-binding protein [Patescibacteria group bacterium]